MKKNNNIPLALGEVRQTINTLVAIVKIVKRANAPAAVKDRCLDQHEYSLMKNSIHCDN